MYEERAAATGVRRDRSREERLWCNTSRPGSDCNIISFTAATKVVTYSGTFVPTPGMTRHEVFLKVRQDHRHLVPGAMNLVAPDVCFFSLEPNELM